MRGAGRERRGSEEGGGRRGEVVRRRMERGGGWRGRVRKVVRRTTTLINYVQWF
jgi:hypothetical protein